MNAQDRQLLDALNLRHERLETSVAMLKRDLHLFAMRLEAPVMAPIVPPPIPEPIPEPAAPELPPLPVPAAVEYVPTVEIPAARPKASAPVKPKAAVPEGLGFEVLFGRWLARIGVVFALLTLIFFSVVAYKDYYRYLGPWSKLGILTLVSGGLFGVGLWLERKSRDLVVYGRTLAGGGLACLYYTLYGATYVEQLQVIHNPLLGGFLLLAWSGGVLYLAEQRKSELLSIFAISLAYFSSAITPVGDFTMVADLLLAATAVVFLVRNAWTGLSYLCLIGTYLGFVRQIFAGQPDVPFDFNLVPSIDFWPSAIYLTGAWVIFTAGIFLAKAPNFDGAKRLAFLSLNNGAWTGLLLIAGEVSHHGHLGDLLLLVGAALLAAYGFARWGGITAPDVADSYLLQGLSLSTAGIAVAYHGLTRGLLISGESVFLASAGAYSRNRFLRGGAMLAALLGAGFLGHELVFTNKMPWVLTFGGAAAMLVNAWLARYDLWREPIGITRSRFVASSALYVCLALGLFAAGIFSHASQAWIPPDLALAGLVFTAAIYLVPLFELPPLSQLLLVIAQLCSFGLTIMALDPPWRSDVGYIYTPQWSQNIVALATMALVLWWPRQTRVAKGWWLAPLMGLYASAMTAYAYDAVRPHVSNEGWMIDAALLSLVFVAFGAWNRSWAFIVSGQILLGLSVYSFFLVNNPHDFPWTWWGALVPVAVVSLTGWIAQRMLSRAFNGDGVMRSNLRVVAGVYQTLAIAMLVRWIFGVVPTNEITLALIALATAFMAGGLSAKSSYFIRVALVLDFAGCCNYGLAGSSIDGHPFTWLDAGAVTLFLAQPALIRHWRRELISDGESWLVILASSLASFLFVSNSITTVGSQDLTLGWALLALALIVIGFAANERRQRWCGLAVLGVAFARVAVHDFWGYSDGEKVLTFLALTVICLGLSFLYYKFAERLKEWL